MFSTSTAAPYSMQPASACTAGTFAWKCSSTAARWPGFAVMMATTWIMGCPVFLNGKGTLTHRRPARIRAPLCYKSARTRDFTMAERSFAKEVEALKLGDGETFRGEGILAGTKALLQSGVAYVGGYQGAPVSHLIDVLVDAQDIMSELGVHLETCTNEASAAAMLGASISYPMRGAVTWKSIVGTNVAADALSNLSSPGVMGGAMIIIGEDYGEGASIIQERSYAYALKCSMWLLDPRPDLPTIVRMVEKGFELSEASHAPVMLELRIRACHVTGSFTASDNRRGTFSTRNRVEGPPRFNYNRLSHPPVTFVQERRKVEDRLPAARAFIRAQGLNEFTPGDLKDTGIVVLGGLYNTVLRALARLGLADNFGNARIPIYCLNLAYPLIPDELKS